MDVLTCRLNSSFEYKWEGLVGGCSESSDLTLTKRCDKKDAARSLQRHIFCYPPPFLPPSTIQSVDSRFLRSVHAFMGRFAESRSLPDPDAQKIPPI